MKRGAETQLTRDNADDDGIEEVSASGEAFAKASQSALAGRVMKPLPNRGSGKQPSAAASPFGASTPSKVEFGAGFKGTGPSSFTFNAPTVPSVPSSNNSSQPPRSTFNFASQPAGTTQSSGPTNASKKLSSILSSSSSSEGEPMDLNGIDSATPEQNYYVSLRGLNASFFNVIETYYNRDKFVDMSIFFERYKAERDNIEQTLAEGKNKSKPLPRPPKTTNGTTSTSPPFGQSAAPAKPFAPPAAPAAFVFGGSTPKSTTSSPTPASAFGSGFVPKPATSGPVASPFSFPTSNSSTPSTPFFSSPSTAPKTSPFSTPASAPKESVFSSSSTSASPFGSSSASDKPAIRISPFNTPSSKATNTTSAFSSEKTSNASPSLFGASTAPAATSSPFGAPKATPFTFGSSTKPASGSIGNPVGFTFGGQPPASADASKAPGALSAFGTSASNATNVFGSSSTMSSGFSFSPSSSSTTTTATSFGNLLTPKASESTIAASQESTDDAAASADGGDTTADGSSKAKNLGENPHDLEGEGEEDEDTLHTIRVKIFRFVDQNPGEKGKWAEAGVGMLRLKKNKTDGTYRLLSRNTANGKIIINFRLFKGFSCKREKQMMGFTGHDDGKQVMYKLRSRTDTDMIAFQEKLDSIIPSLS